MIIFDLDGTLADIRHRRHFVENGAKDWDAFFDACDKDVPTMWCSVLASLWASGHDIQIWSGRSDVVRDKTEKWLEDNIYKPRRTVGRPLLRMRAEGDYSPDYKLKKSWLNELLVSGVKPAAVFDDRTRLVDMWRDHGIPCAQVAPGDF